MYYSGLLPKFKVNRPLLEEERENHLPTDKALNIEPTSALSVTRVNSTYLEVTDKFYPWKGFFTAISLFVPIMGALMVFAPWQAFFFHIYDQVMDGDDKFLDLFLLSIGSLIGVAVLILGVWCSRVESFRYTHYPIRLNRKNRKVYNKSIKQI